MSDVEGVPKIHPATRAVEPEDPLNLFGYEFEGDPELMLSMIVEEYARMGYDCDALMELARNPFYQAVPEAVQVFLAQERLTFLLAPRAIVADVLFLAAVTVLASWFPARRAARLKPVTAMHHVG